MRNLGSRSLHDPSANEDCEPKTLDFSLMDLLEDSREVRAVKAYSSIGASTIGFLYTVRGGAHTLYIDLLEERNLPDYKFKVRYSLSAD